ncbi:hypothetical protein BJX66DRAFT_350761 [Aspergillus keveii]|uniref:C2H2 type zinc finger domain protein n=1 Tax=Aspergillus keveii TaxID=714993 RepID=A0ABR4G843_9EURO
MRLGRMECRICSKLYKRREHLQRHIASHTSNRPHQCTTCDSTFQRTDVLRRHLKTCPGRRPSQSNCGGRRRSCDRCIRLKKSCNSRQPCQRCTSQDAACCYSASSAIRQPSETAVVDSLGGIDLDLDFGTFLDHPVPTTTMPPAMPGSFFPDLVDYSSLSWQDFLTMTAGGETLRTPPILDTDSLRSLRFLDKFTSNTGFVSSFDCGTEAQRHQVISDLHLPAMRPLDPSLGSGQQFIPTDSLPASWIDDPLSLKTHQILLLVKEVVMIKPRNSAVTLDWSPVLEQMCLQFFSPANLRKFLQLYWSIWHPNVNFVHRPSFDPLSAKPSILATMALIGACVSPLPADNDNARMWFNCVEELVFIDEDFNSDLAISSATAIGRQRHKIQALQAAYMVCLYQTWEGDDASKRRVRRNRFATLVSTARDVGIPMARHTQYSRQQRYEFDWMDFAVREELVRLLTWIFLLDTAFIIFNNLPPRMVIKEMKINTAVPEACFQALTADECFEQLQLFLPPESPYWKVSLCSAFQTLCKNNLAVSARDGLASLGPLNLFVLASAIHSLIFQYRNSWDSLQLLPPIHNALNNWKSIWQQFTASLVPGMSPHVTVDHDNLQPDTMWKRVGFCSYCPEYWLLANLMTDMLTARNSTEASDEGEQNELERLEDGPLDSILNKYDQTSMRQVNDLILSLSDFRIAG